MDVVIVTNVFILPHTHTRAHTRTRTYARTHTLSHTHIHIYICRAYEGSKSDLGEITVALMDRLGMASVEELPQVHK